MKKPGIALNTVAEFPAALLVPLVDQFSISTAEEFVAMAKVNSEAIRITLGIDEEAFNAALAAAQNNLSQDFKEHAEAAPRVRYAKGAIFGGGKQMDPNLAKHLKKE